MVTNSSPPRVPPMRDEELDSSARAVVSEFPPGSVVNITRTLLWHPDVLSAYRTFGTKLRRGILPARDLELVILRIAWRCRAETEWGGHVHAALESGLSERDIARIPEGPDALGWSAFDSVLLAAVDELHDVSSLSDETWARLADVYDRRQMIEFVLVVGNYHMLSYVMNAFRIEREPGWPGFPPAYGAKGTA